MIHHMPPVPQPPPRSASDDIQFLEAENSELTLHDMSFAPQESIHKRLRLKAIDTSGKELARCSCRLEDGGTLRFWLPQLTLPPSGENGVKRVFRGFLNFLEDILAPPIHCARLETKPGEDLPHWLEWTDSLRAMSFDKVASGHIYRRAPGTSCTKPTGYVRVERMNKVARSGICEAVESVFTNTASRHEVVEWRGAEAYVDELVDSCDDSLNASFVACGKGVVLGYVFADNNDFDEAGKRQGWIYGLGVRPSFRRQGIASELLRHALCAMSDSDSSLLAFIDDMNLPSREIFDTFGFKQDAHAHFIFRKEFIVNQHSKE